MVRWISCSCPLWSYVRFFFGCILSLIALLTTKHYCFCPSYFLAFLFLCFAFLLLGYILSFVFQFPNTFPSCVHSTNFQVYCVLNFIHFLWLTLLILLKLSSLFQLLYFSICDISVWFFFMFSHSGVILVIFALISFESESVSWLVTCNSLRSHGL